MNLMNFRHVSLNGLKENTVDQKVKRGLEKLRKTLEGGGFYEG